MSTTTTIISTNISPEKFHQLNRTSVALYRSLLQECRDMDHRTTTPLLSGSSHNNNNNNLLNGKVLLQPSNNNNNNNVKKNRAIALESLKPSESKNSLCLQSYAHSRITQLLHLRDAAQFASDELLNKLLSLRETCKTYMAECIEEEALPLALEANIVVKGLTAMVTIDEKSCVSFGDETEICRDGETYSTSAPTNGSFRPGISSFLLTILCICFAQEMFF